MPAPLLTVRVDGAPTVHQVRHANTWWRRAIGLLATRSLHSPCGLWLKPCNGVHMFWMHYAIDVVFLNRSGVVLKVVHGLKPWRVAACAGAASTLELREGMASDLALTPGVRLQLDQLER